MKLSAICCEPAPWEEKKRIQFMKELGYDACDWGLGDAFIHDGVFMTDEEIKEHFTTLKGWADEVGMEVGQTHSDFSGHPRNYNFDYDEIVARQIASIKATHYLGCKYCVIHPIITPGRHYDILEDECFKQNVEFFGKLRPTLEEYDVYACIENMWVCDPVYGHICSTICSRATELVALCNALGDRYKICLDTGHCNVTGDDVIEAVHTCGKLLAVLHCHQTDGYSDLHTIPFAARSTLPGTKPRVTDWEEFVKALKEEGYEGNLNWEVCPPGPEDIRIAGYKFMSAAGHYLINKFNEA